MINSELIFFLFASLIIFSILYIFPKFTYTLTENSIKVKWQLLSFIPFITYTIKIKNIENIQEFSFKKHFANPIQVLGNLFIKKGVIITTKGKFFRYNLYLTPDDSDIFIRKIESIIGK